MTPPDPVPPPSAGSAASGGPPSPRPAPSPLPRVRVSCREEFSAAHQLIAPGLDERQNRALYGPCADLHGHNYTIELTVEGPVEPATGMVVNFTSLFGLLREAVLGPCDHKNLNVDVPCLHGLITTAENMAVAFWDLLAPQVAAQPGCRLVRIGLSETSRTRVEYAGPSGYTTA